MAIKNEIVLMGNYLLTAVKSYAINYAGLPKNCWQGITLASINAVSIGVCFFLSIYFVNERHFNIAIAGFLISFYGMGTVAGGIIGGKLSDKFLPKTVSIVCLLIQGAAFISLLHIKSIESLIVNLFILGVASYAFKTSNNVRILNHCSEKSEIKLRVIGMMHIGSNLGLGLSGILIGILSQYGFHNIFYLSGILIFISAIFIFFQQEERTIYTYVKEPEKNNNIQKSNHKLVLLVLICLFSIGMIIAQLSTTYPIYVEDAFPQLGVKAVSILFVLDTVLIVLFQAPITNYLSQYNKMLVVGIGAFLMGFGMLILSFSSVFSLALLSCGIWTLGEILFMSTAQLVCYENGGNKKKGQRLGMFQSTYALSCVAGPIAGSYIYKSMGGDILWYISAVIGLLCLFACFYNRDS